MYDAPAWVLVNDTIQSKKPCYHSFRHGSCYIHVHGSKISSVVDPAILEYYLLQRSVRLHRVFCTPSGVSPAFQHLSPSELKHATIFLCQQYTNLRPVRITGKNSLGRKTISRTPYYIQQLQLMHMCSVSVCIHVVIPASAWLLFLL